ncbi:tetratricopeptide repeat protein [Trichuris suis]|nr:tetratricopeptide repeat protein [Trichuris suis]
MPRGKRKFASLASNTSFIKSLSSTITPSFDRTATSWEDVSVDDIPRSSAVDCVDAVEDLILLRNDCYVRRLTKAALWAEECLYYLPKENVTISRSSKKYDHSVGEKSKSIRRLFCQTQMDMRNYSRASDWSKSSKDPVFQFLHFASRLKAFASKVREIKRSTGEGLTLEHCVATLEKITSEMERTIGFEHMDAYLLLLYGSIWAQRGCCDVAMSCFARAVTILPRCYPAWRQLAKHTSNTDELVRLMLPNHWMRSLCCIDVSMRDNNAAGRKGAVSRFDFPQFRETPYFLSKVGDGYRYGIRLSEALEAYRKMRLIEPGRVCSFGEYSNLLFDMGEAPELISLAYDVFEGDRCTVSSSIVLGKPNYWCIRKNYVLMLVHVLRALYRDDSSATLWTLLGHANVELQELGASCIAYQQAVEHSHNDYRAWYGMGQSFQVLEFPAFALCYFVRAYALKTEDPRITTSLADGYLALGLSTSAERCYWKSFYRGDPEKVALTHLAFMYQAEGKGDEAIAIYKALIAESGSSLIPTDPRISRIYVCLSDYYLKLGDTGKAHFYAMALLGSDDFRDEAKAQLGRIRAKFCDYKCETMVEFPAPLVSTT